MAKSLHFYVHLMFIVLKQSNLTSVQEFGLFRWQFCCKELPKVAQNIEKSYLAVETVWQRGICFFSFAT